VCSKIDLKLVILQFTCPLEVKTGRLLVTDEQKIDGPMFMGWKSVIEST